MTRNGLKAHMFYLKGRKRESVEIIGDWFIKECESGLCTKKFYLLITHESIGSLQRPSI